MVFEELIRLFPSADIFALYTGTPRVTIGDVKYKIQTSWLQNLPIWARRHPGRMLPFLAQAAEQFDFSDYDLVISSASGFAKGVITRSNVPHICYCHTPTRYLWDSTFDATKRAPTFSRWPLKAILHYLRLMDYAAAQRVDTFIANSEYTAERIATYYRRDSKVIYPPINTAFFTPGPIKTKDAPFITVSRLTPSKHLEQAISVCDKLNLPLTIIGTGQQMCELKKIAGPKTTFTGKVSQQELRHHYRTARALLQPGVEDFGMATAEALACGTPVIAYNRGGVKEIVSNYEHGYLYNEQRSEALAEAIRRFITFEDQIETHTLQKQAMRFSEGLWQAKMLNEVEIARKKGDTG